IRLSDLSKSLRIEPNPSRIHRREIISSRRLIQQNVNFLWVCNTWPTNQLPMAINSICCERCPLFIDAGVKKHVGHDSLFFNSDGSLQQTLAVCLSGDA